MANPCLFCQIGAKSLVADIVFENDHIVAFKDIHPKAPVHLLFIPKKHITSLAEATPEDQALLGELLLTLTQVAREQGIEKNGYRVIINTRHHGGQEVDHLHVHLLGGEPLGPMRTN